ncbi:hypothetical protein CO712_18940 [Burkholderia gladioli pv. gladioli]|nr:hypothetical protein CO712_18940 [Burkholderia gladioli pv. gladioli]
MRSVCARISGLDTRTKSRLSGFHNGHWRISMPNPGKPIAFNGEVMTASAWARKFGINPITLRARLNRYGMDIERALSSEKLYPKPESGWYPIAHEGGRDYEHRRIAEAALGKALPPKAEVHHVDENRLNNDPGNLVICPDHAYHALLHLRTRALRESGNANNRRCVYCKKWDSLEMLTITKQNGAHHPKCHADYHAALRRKKSQSTNRTEP